MLLEAVRIEDQLDKRLTTCFQIFCTQTLNKRFEKHF